MTAVRPASTGTIRDPPLFRAESEPGSELSPDEDRSHRYLGARVVAFGVLLLGLLTTVVVAILISGQVNRENALRLARAQDGIEQDLAARLDIYSETLVGLQGLFAASDGVSRIDFVEFAEATEVFERFRGLQGLSFSPMVRRGDVTAFEAAVRADRSVNGVGYPDFAVRPDGTAADLYVVDFIVPLEGNEAAFGFDLGSNPARRAAIEEARDTGRIVATAPITLVQEAEEQVGVLLLAPAYDGPSGTVAERRASFIGVFSAVLRMGDLLDGASSQRDLGFAIFDQSPDQAETTGGRTELYATTTGDFRDAPAGVAIDAAGRTWGIVLDPSTVPRVGHSRLLILLGGLVAALPYSIASYFSYRERDRLHGQTAALRAANAEIRSSNADLERFAYVAAHDLRSPIRAVRNVVDMLGDELAGTEPPPSVDDLLGHLDRSAGKMDAMVTGLLEFATIKGGDADNDDTVDVAALVRASIDEVRNGGEVTLSAEVGDLHPVRGNPVLIERLFDNLIGNAVKYRSEDRDLEIRVSSERVGDLVMLSVADNGIGIAPKYHERIFEIFRRLHGPGEIEGRGLGLALCRKIVEHHGGRIWVASEENAGSTFKVTLPVATS